VKNLNEEEKNCLGVIWGIKKNYNKDELAVSELSGFIGKEILSKLKKKGFIKTHLVQFVDLSLSKRVGLRNCIFFTETGKEFCENEFSKVVVY
jgi:hypothetical protein